MSTLQDKIAALHASPALACIAVTGAGAGCQNILAQVPGASQTLLECLMPYSNEALINFLGERPQQFASEDTALRMAARAWRRGRALALERGVNPNHVIGLGLTAVVGTNRRLRGAHRVFVAIRDATRLAVMSLQFEKGADGFSLLGRDGELELSDELAVRMLLWAAGLEPEPLSTGRAINPRIIAEVSMEFSANILCLPNGEVRSLDVLSPERHIIFSGSFNPFHSGHEEIAAEVQRYTSKQVVFAINTRHPVKGVLPREEIGKRLHQFRSLAPVAVLTQASLYLELAEALPGFGLVLGADALARMLDPVYYSGSVEDMCKRFKALDTHFFVASREMGETTLQLHTLLERVPSSCHDLFTPLHTRNKWSSSQISSSF